MPSLLLEEIYCKPPVGGVCMRIGCVMCVRNEGSVIARCLESLDSQTLRPDYYYVVNDGSSDDTGRILRGWGGGKKHVKLVEIPEHGADIVASQDHVIKGIAWMVDVAKCDMILRVDGDIVPGQHDFSRLVRHTVRDGKVYASGMVGSEDHGFREGFSALMASWFNDNRQFVRHSFFCNMIMMWNAKRAGRLGYYPDVNPGLVRRTGANYDRKLFRHIGHAYRFLGYTRTYALAKTVRMFATRPLMAAAFWVGYCGYDTPAGDGLDGLREYVRDHQWDRLKSKP